MSRKQEDEDYWNTSDTIGFSFDDEENASASSLFESVKLSSGVKNQRDTSASSSSVFGEFSQALSTAKALETLVSKRSIALILDEPVPRVEPIDPKIELEKIQKQCAPQTPETTVRSIILGRPYSLHSFRSLESKTMLLEEAVKSGDGNAILAILLFLQKTLKKKLFTQLLQFHNAALPVYLNYLTTRFEIRAAVDILLVLGRMRQAALKDFQFQIHSNQTLDKRLNILKALMRDHFSLPNAEDKVFLVNFLKFVEWQISANQRGCSVSGTVLECLDIICKDHWHEGKGQLLSPQALIQMLNVTERQYHWSVITSRASAKAWDDVSGVLLTKGWLGAKKLKSVLSAERIVMELHKQDAPENILAEYFSLIENLEKRMDLARKLSWHSAAIETFVAMRDRQGLLQYHATLNPQTSDSWQAETALRFPGNKWKN